MSQSAVPRRIGAGRYELGPTLGVGGAADVYRATDTTLQREVAVKVLRDRTDGDEHRARFLREAQVLARLAHPHLVMLFDAGIDDVGGEQPFLAMELVEGTSLAVIVREHLLSSDRAATIGRQVAEALAYAHGEGVVHRDIKPGNVLVARGDRVKLADFGIARLVDDTVRHTRTGTAIGTAAYLAPEQVSGERVDGACDVYALGLMLAECLTGTRPFGDGTPTEVALARLTRDPDLPSSLSPAWRALLTDMTRRSPTDRPSADDVAERLARIHLPGEATQPMSSLETATVSTMVAGTAVTPAVAAPAAPPASATRVLETVPEPGPATTPAPSRQRSRSAAMLAQWRRWGGDRRAAILAIAGIVVLIAVAGIVGLSGGSSSSQDQLPDGVPQRYQAPLQNLHESVVDR